MSGRTLRVVPARRKLLSILPRSALECLSEMESPWRADRQTLIENALHNWNAEEVREAVQYIINVAEQEL